MKQLSKKKQEIIEDNYRAYICNFETPVITPEDFGGGYYVFRNEEEYKHGTWVQYCYDINYLNGWLYGAVQAKCGQLRVKKED